MSIACLRCEGSGVVRKYLNHAGDYNKYHCPKCLGTGQAEYDQPHLEEEIRRREQQDYEQRRAAKKAAKKASPSVWRRLFTAMQPVDPSLPASGPDLQEKD